MRCQGLSWGSDERREGKCRGGYAPQKNANTKKQHKKPSSQVRARVVSPLAAFKAVLWTGNNMCRFIVYKGRSSAQRVLVADLVVTPVHSVIKQSFDCKERTVAGAVPPQLNADGFGTHSFRVVALVADTALIQFRVMLLLLLLLLCVCVCPCARVCVCVCMRADMCWAYMRCLSCLSGVGWYSDQCACGLDSHDAPSRSGGVRERTHAPPSPGSDESGGDDKRDGSQRHFAAHVCPGVFTSISPAWNNDNLYRLSHKVQSPLVFAHVRAASLGSVVSEANCHPFAVGKYMFMHNGCVRFLACVDAKRPFYDCYACLYGARDVRCLTTSMARLFRCCRPQLCCQLQLTATAGVDVHHEQRHGSHPWYH